MITKTNNSIGDTDSVTIDDFKVIHGIGASVEDRLHKAEILTFKQLAEKSSQEIADILNGMVGFTPERIDDQDWIGQALKFAPKDKIHDDDSKLSNSQGQQHYEVFTVELLMDEENNVRRTRVKHVQSQHEKLWAGWDENRLQDFITSQASLDFLETSETVPVDKEYMIPKKDTLPEATPVNEPQMEAALETPILNIIDNIRALKMEPHYIGFGQSTNRTIPENQPFNMRITLDLTDVDQPEDAPIYYIATIYTKKIGNGVRKTLGMAQGKFMPADNVIIDVGAPKLSRGSYRMDAVLTLSLSDRESPLKSIPMAITEGAMIQVY